MAVIIALAVGVALFGLGVWVGVMVAPAVTAWTARREWLEADREAETSHADVREIERIPSPASRPRRSCSLARLDSNQD